MLRPKRLAFAWLLRPQEDGSLRPRRSVCYALGALVRTSTRRIRSEAELIRFINTDTAPYDKVALDAFASRLCAIKPNAAKAMRLVRTWRRHWIHLRDRALDAGTGGETEAFESVAADAFTCPCTWRSWRRE